MDVELASKVRKQLTKVPVHIAKKFALWVDLVRLDGLDVARAIPGFRITPSRGEWQGYRAIRLSDAYRTIYILRDRNSVETVCVEEVNKHDY